MSLNVTMKQAPSDAVGSDTKYAVQHHESLSGPTRWHLPFVRGDLFRIRGLLEGLAGCVLDGWIEFTVHEGLLLTAKGALDVYDPRTDFAISLIMNTASRTLSGVAAAYPTLEFRLKCTYETTWNFPAQH